MGFLSFCQAETCAESIYGCTGPYHKNFLGAVSMAAWDLTWWVKAAGGEPYVVPLVGFPPIVCEAVYLKYLHGQGSFDRKSLCLLLGYLKRYPKRGFSGTRFPGRVIC